MTTAFITGITGQDGQLLASKLSAHGVEVHGLVLSTVNSGTIPFSEGVVFHQGDLSQPETVASVIKSVKPDEIYNLGGLGSVAFSWGEPVTAGTVNGIGAVAVMAAARDLQQSEGRQVKVLQASSSEIFGQASEIPQNELTPIRPINPYGAAKAYAHMQAAIFRSQGIPVSTAILYNHESTLRPETFVTRKITSAAARIAHDGGGYLALGNLDVRRDWGWAPDYVDAMILANRHPVPDDYVIATGETHSVADFVAAAFKRVGIPDWQNHIRIDPQFVRPVDPSVQVGDNIKARRVLGWEPTVTFAELVNRMVDHDIATLNG